MGDGLADAERIADGENEIADLQRIGVGEFEERKRRAVLDAHDGKIGARILQHHGGFELALVGQRHLDLVGTLDDVDVGDDQPGRIDDDAGAERTLHLVARPARTAAEEAAEDRIVEQRVARLHGLCRIDVHDGGGDVLDDGRIGQPHLVGGRHAAVLRRRRGDRCDNESKCGGYEANHAKVPAMRSERR